MPLGGGGVGVLFSVTGAPSKHGDPPSDAPPRASQKSDCDCQRSVSLVEFEFVGAPARPCNEAAKGEFRIETLLQVVQTCEQKLLVACLDCVEFGDIVELHSTGTSRGPESTLKSSAEN